MDPISFAIGVASIASVFQTCIHGYRSLNTAMAIGDSAIDIYLQFRVEEVRLQMWGRDWGLSQDEVETSDDGKHKGSPGAGGGGGDADAKNGSRPSQKRTTIDDLDVEYEIPGLRNMTIEILGRISKALQDWKAVGAKYGAARGLIMSELGLESSEESLSTILLTQKMQSKGISKGTSLTSKFRWAIKDKEELQDILKKLREYNNSLKDLLPTRERLSLARGLAGELLNIIESRSLEGTELGFDALSHVQGIEGEKAACIVRLKASNRTEKPERVLDEGIVDDAASKKTPFAKPSDWIKGTAGDMEIPFAHFIRLADPKITKIEVQKESGRWIQGRYVPLQRSLGIYAPPASEPATASQLSSDDADLQLSERTAQVTLVEWRPMAHESRASELSEQDLKDRRDHIARLLHQTSITNAEFRVLDCLGYTTAPGHTSDGSTHDLVGYVYRFPEFASPKSLPVSLRELLGEAYISNNPKVPSLEQRFRLARSLAVALFQLQCAGWIHRKLSSYNVIFFRDHTTDELNLDRPFLVGWQYARPDDQRRLFPSEQGSEGIGDLDMYVHRMRLHQGGYGRYPRFRKSFDIYSLGIVLIEIAFWEPILSLADEKERKKMEARDESIQSWLHAKDWWEAILKTANDEIAAEMGASYKEAVLFCLCGGRTASKVDAAEYRNESERNSREKYYVDTDFEEIGIEKEFYWSVMKPLERFGM